MPDAFRQRLAQAMSYLTTRWTMLPIGALAISAKRSRWPGDRTAPILRGVDQDVTSHEKVLDG